MFPRAIIVSFFGPYLLCQQNKIYEENVLLLLLLFVIMNAGIWNNYYYFVVRVQTNNLSTEATTSEQSEDLQLK